MTEEKYKPHRHKPANPNDLHRAEHETSGINQRIAVAMTRGLSTMEAVWIITAFMAIWIIGNVTIWRFDPAPFALLLIVINLPQIASTPLIMVGQSVLNRKQELQAEETYESTLKSFHDVELILSQNNEQIKILEEQNKQIAEQGKLQATQYQELLKQTEMLVQLLTSSQKRKTTRLEVKS